MELIEKGFFDVEEIVVWLNIDIICGILLEPDCWWLVLSVIVASIICVASIISVRALSS